ncbi:MAG: hypothetical protein AAF438_05045, partial [Pseudomonadota bacterium]
LQYATVKKIIVGNDPRLHHAFPSAAPCQIGQEYNFGGVFLKVLYPALGSDLVGNNGSCVVRIESSAGSVLLPGDIEAAGEVLTLDENLEADVVLGPHHGSATSSRESWVERTHAGVVIFSAAHKNHWGFPNQRVVDRWHAIGATTLCTGTSGAVRVFFATTKGAQLSEERLRRRRFWHQPPESSSGCY